MKLQAKEAALVGVFAALFAVVSRLPGIPIVGLPIGAGKIELTAVLAPIVGIILGPWLGALTTFIGDFIAWIIPKTTFFGLLMLPTDPIAAMVAGALVRRERTANWKVSAAILLALNLLWYATPPGMEVIYYPFLHLGALALILLCRRKIAEFVSSGAREKLGYGVTVASFSGVMANHMAGNLIFIASVGWFIQLKAIKNTVKALGLYWLKSGLPKGEVTGLGALFAGMLPISVVERLIMTAIAAFLGAAILYALRKSRIISI